MADDQMPEDPGSTKGLSDSKQVLLRALESIEECESEVGSEVRHVCVVYSVYRENEKQEIEESGGWNHTADPAWLIGTMLRRAATFIEGDLRPKDEEPEDEP